MFTPTYLETAAALGGDLSGTIADAQIIADAVTSVEIADNAVGNSELTDNAVNTAELTDAAVTAIKIANDAVTTNKILNLNVTSAKIADDAVTSAKIADDAVTSAKIANDAVLRINITDGAINTAKIEDDAVTNEKLAGSINPNKITVADANIIVGNGGTGSAVALSGDATIINTGVLTVSAIQGIAVSTTDPTANQVLAYNNTNSRWEPKTLGRSRVRAFRNATQSINTNTDTKIDFDSETFDSNNDFASGTFTAPVTGYYQVNARVRITYAGGFVANTRTYLMIFTEGNLYSIGNRLGLTTSATTTLNENSGTTITDIVFLNSGETLDIRVYHNRGASSNIVTGSAESYVSIHLLSE